MAISRLSRLAVVAAIIALSATAFATPPCSVGRSYANSNYNAATVYEKQAVILAVPVGVPVAKVSGILYSFDAASAAYVQQSAETIKSDEEKRIDRIYEGIKSRQQRDAAAAAVSSSSLRIQFCSACHSPANAKGGLDITGELSADVAATCISRILEDDEAIRMPRKAGHLDQADNLPPDAIGKLIKELNAQKGIAVASRPKVGAVQSAQPQTAAATLPPMTSTTTDLDLKTGKSTTQKFEQTPTGDWKSVPETTPPALVRPIPQPPSPNKLKPEAAK